MKALHFVLRLGVLLALPLSAVPANAADPPDESALQAARDKFRQALSLQTGGDWAGALSLLRQVGALKMTPQVRFNMALCQENLGELVAALGDYELAASEADDTGAVDVAAEAVQRLESLRSRIPKLVIERAEGAGVARVMLDGVGVGATVLGKPMPVDPGQHVVEASAAGFAPFRESFQISEQERKFVRVTLRALTPAASEAVTEEALGTAPGPEPSPSRLLPFVVGGIGAASLVASGVFYALRASAVDELDATCGPARDQCPKGSEEIETRGRTYTTLANVTLGVGVIGLGAGAILWFSGPNPKQTSRAGIRPMAPGAHAGMTFVGRF